ncbi:MAG: phospholipid/cholesterol/gamma-HCH transport system substrate-binding protein [Thermoleophilaceae bacterium]|jgi:phospholipid/cholesterol/gamma-HCH transport system substrate-binding protein|nr:phospholipid/cholesterol/gamma-HCH transport system substrate-binding protein [Thermoleophilaceae bacterium]
MTPKRDEVREDGGVSPAVRGLVAGLILVAAIAVAIVLFAGDGGYRVTAEFVNAGQLVKGSEVRVAGTTVGTVDNIDVSQSGTAEVTFTVDGAYAPLRRGTQATVKPTSLSGIANRFIDLQLGPDDGRDIEDGGHIGTEDTATAVELDEVFALFDKETRGSLRDFVKGQADTLRGRGAELRRGIHYLNPALSTGSRLFEELTRDEPLLKRFVVDSATLVNALASRRGDLTGVVSNLNATFGALGSQQSALAESIDRLPPFLRRANTTFVNLRAALDDVDPLVNAAKPAVRRLGPFLDQARLFAQNGEPTIRDLSRTIRAAGSSNDLIELIDSFPVLSRVALDNQTVNGASRRGAFPETTAALRAAAPTISLGRAYTPDFVGWLDDFSTTGGYDAVGGYSRAWINLSELLYGPGPKLGQFRRCPGANEVPAADGSNVISAGEAAALACDPSQRSVGP